MAYCYIESILITMLHIPNVYHPLFILDFVFLVFNGENPSLFAIPGIPVVLKCPPDSATPFSGVAADLA